MPTSADIHDVDANGLLSKLDHLVDHLAGHGIERDLIWQQTMLTPSCGMGTMTVDEARLVMTRLAEVAERVQARLR